MNGREWKKSERKGKYLCITFVSKYFFLVDVKLFNGEKPNIGDIYISIEGTWTSICNSNTDSRTRVWGLKETNVVCRMLGFPNATLTMTFNLKVGSSFSLGIDTAVCSGEEESLAKCPKFFPYRQGRYCMEITSAVCGTPPCK